MRVSLMVVLVVALLLSGSDAYLPAVVPQMTGERKGRWMSKPRSFSSDDRKSAPCVGISISSYARSSMSTQLATRDMVRKATTTPIMD